MAGMNLPTGAGAGVTGSVVGGLYGTYPSAAVPAASTVPEGPRTITQAGFGVPSAASSGGSNIGLRAAAISTGALILLGLIWWLLPR